ncbi:acyltransferase family protein [Pseudomonas turukhanskensis]|uniref:Acyltransferase n=1 Tax=Pseudomonas turukhanskensis TaxID=1806536 RepID=A0A9W6K4H8_9PSED|nr:acyltransferase [Pseudomonas turukhanskensis]GLK88098.1 acyltransferase [Pseudomonas turukhanskensis]
MTYSTPRRFYSLDFIRGVAALAVVFWHWQHFFFQGSTFVPYEMEQQPFYNLFFLFYQTGWLAVDFFFSLSGFIFFWLYARQIAQREVGGWAFFALRFSRLYPLHLATLVFVLVAQRWVLAHTGDYFVVPYNDLYHGILNLFFASSWGFEKGPSFNGPIWSVSVEVLMYLVFFFVCLLFRQRLWAHVGMLALGVVVMVLEPIVGRGIFSFFLGGLVFRFYQHVCARGWLPRVLPWAVGTAALLWVFTVVEVHSPWFWPHVQALLQSLLPERFAGLADKAVHGATRAIVVAVLFPLSIFSLALLETKRGYLGRRLAMVGNLTYSSYLLHFPLQLCFFVVAGQLGLGQAFFYGELSMLIFFAVLIPLCLLSYFYFETPAQTYLRTRLLSFGTKEKRDVGTQKTLNP